MNTAVHTTTHKGRQKYILGMTSPSSPPPGRHRYHGERGTVTSGEGVNTLAGKAGGTVQQDDGAGTPTGETARKDLTR